MTLKPLYMSNNTGINQRPDKKSLYSNKTILERIKLFNKNSKYMRTKIKSITQNLCLPPISKQFPLREIIDRTLNSQILQLSMKNISKIYLCCGLGQCKSWIISD